MFVSPEMLRYLYMSRTSIEFFPTLSIEGATLTCCNKVKRLCSCFMNYFVSLEIVTCYPKISLCVKNPSCSPTLSLIKLQLNSNFTVSVPTADEMGFFCAESTYFHSPWYDIFTHGNAIYWQRWEVYRHCNLTFLDILDVFDFSTNI